MPTTCLMLTVRSLGEPFVGSMNIGGTTTMIESPTAEVIWFAVPNGRTIPADTTAASVTTGSLTVTLSPSTLPVQLYTLYRRVLLIDPTYFNANYTALSSYATPRLLQQTCDLSVYPVNPLGDATTAADRVAQHTFDIDGARESLLSPAIDSVWGANGLSVSRSAKHSGGPAGPAVCINSQQCRPPPTALARMWS